MTEATSGIKSALSPYWPLDVDGVELLVELALDLHWSWSHKADNIWRKLDPDLWGQTHNPWIVLKSISWDRLRSMLSDPDFRKEVEERVKNQRSLISAQAWFQKTHPDSTLKCAAYFSMEFMLSEALPIYSGGLGNVAGDQLKAASDLGVPVIGVGLLYQQGYFRQIIDKEGAQQALYPYNDPGQLPITPLRKPNGEWLRIEISLPGWSVWFRTWQVQVGRVKLYLLDSNDAANYPAHRGITSELYGGDSELRLKQELVLGIGGWRLLESLGYKPDVCHLNEGHAAFAILERARDFMKETGQPFEIALAATRSGNLFTTHTAVAAGFDRFPPTMIREYLGKYAENQLGISTKDLLALGRQNADDENESFNMAYLAVRGSGAVNAVSQLHGKVSREIFAPIFPRWPIDDIPIGHITNGVHMPSWDSKSADTLWTTMCGKDRWLQTPEILDQKFRKVTDEQLWKMRNEERKTLVEFARGRLARQLAARGMPAEQVEQAKHLFDPNTLTLGFARRFATYKRPNLLLHDKERLLRILSNAQRPVQLFISGKAHPKDKPGQNMIQQWILFMRTPEARPHIMFFTDYDMHLTEHLVQGVDVWINTPRRPWEACGTSGMKILVNGGLNLSELDGWWAEAYTPEVGWALGDGKEHGDDPAYDAIEANALYELLEQQIVPEFYTRDENGVPKAWTNRIRESMSRLTPRFSANRAVIDYTENHYIPAAKKYHELTADKGKISNEIVNWENNLKNNWSFLRFVDLKVETVADKHKFEVHVYLNELDPDSVKVQLFANDSNSDKPIEKDMTRIRELGGTSVYVFQAEVSAEMPKEAYTPRVIPQHADVSVPLEADEILWWK